MNWGAFGKPFGFGKFAKPFGKFGKPFGFGKFAKPFGKFGKFGYPWWGI